MSELLPDLFLLTGLTGFCACLLVFARKRFSPSSEAVIEEINRLLPQTQCAQCGYPGCRPYAQAIAEGEAINRCPPGGDATINMLATLLGRELSNLAEDLKDKTAPHLAVIRESDCIGCTLCIAACPVDAIIGTQQQMHTVIAAHCTGCELCLEPCPVDCIDLEALSPTVLPGFPLETMACINCGWCEEVCPRFLQPQLLYRSRRYPEQLAGLGLHRCIECDRCDQVCPSEISLTASFRASKAVSSRQQKEGSTHTRNEARYLAHEARLNRSGKNVVSRPSRDDKDALLESLRAGQ